MRGLRILLKGAVFLLPLTLWSSHCSAGEAPSKEERIENILKRFPNADTNGDGTLSQDELRTLREKVRERKGEKRNALPKPDLANVKYGPHERNVLDLWKAESEKPTPLAIYIHGGDSLEVTNVR